MNATELANERIYIELPRFTGRNVPIKEIAAAMGKDPQFVRIGLKEGWLDFGYAKQINGAKGYNYYCPDKKVWEAIGYFRDTDDAAK